MMKYRLYVLPLLIACLVACGDEDNSEPPAALTEFTPSAKLSLLWAESTGGGDKQQYLFIEPLVLHDKVITAGRSGLISILSLSYGDIIDEIDVEATLSGGVGGNDDFWLVTTRNGEVIAIDSETRKIAWRTKVPSEVLSKPVIHNNSVIARSVDGQIVSLNLDSGEINWIFHRSIPALTLRGSSTPVVSRDRIYAGLENGRIVALAPDSGEVIWDMTLTVPKGRSEIQRLVDIDGHAELYGRILYAASYQGRIAAVDVERGQFVWARPFSSYSGVTSDQEMIYSSDDRSHIWALDRSNGATLWKQDKLQARAVTRPVQIGDYLVVGDYDGYLHVLSREDGRFIARTQMSNFGDNDGLDDDIDSDAGIIIAPIVKGDMILVASRDGMLYAYAIKKL